MNKDLLTPFAEPMQDSTVISRFGNEFLRNIADQLQEKIEKKNTKRYELQNKKDKKIEDVYAIRLLGKDIDDVSSLIKDVNYIRSQYGDIPDDFLIKTQGYLQETIPYLNDGDIKKIRSAFKNLYNNYDIGNTKRIEEVYSNLKERLHKAGINTSKIIYDYKYGDILINEKLLDGIKKETYRRKGIEKVNVNWYNKINTDLLLFSQREMLSKISKVINSNVKLTPGVRKIKSLGYKKINELFETIERNEKANIHLSSYVSVLKEQIPNIPKEKNKENLKLLIATLEGIIKKNSRENEQLTNTLNKLELNQIDRILDEYNKKQKEEAKENNEMIAKSLEDLAIKHNTEEYISHQSEDKVTITKFKEIKEVKKEEKKKTLDERVQNKIAELEEKAFDTLYNSAYYHVDSDSIGLTKSEKGQRILEVMRENIKMINMTPQERAKKYLKAHGLDVNPYSINSVSATFLDYNIGVNDYKAFIEYVNLYVSDKKQAKKIIEEAINKVNNVQELNMEDNMTL